MPGLSLVAPLCRRWRDDQLSVRAYALLDNRYLRGPDEVVHGGSGTHVTEVRETVARSEFRLDARHFLYTSSLKSLDLFCLSSLLSNARGERPSITPMMSGSGSRQHSTPTSPSSTSIPCCEHLWRFLLSKAAGDVVLRAAILRSREHPAGVVE